MTSSNRTLFVFTFLSGFAISERATLSVCVSIALFLLGKFFDYVVKPRVEAFLGKRKGQAVTSDR